MSETEKAGRGKVVRAERGASRSASRERVSATHAPAGRASVGDLDMAASASPLQLLQFERTLTTLHEAVGRYNVQLQGGADGGGVQAIAQRGLSGGGGPLPHLERIQSAFGRHDVSGVKGHTGGAAQSANRELGALGYASGNDVAFRGAPSLHTAAHEAAHVVQQRAGVALKGGVGQVGDRYERHADQVADAVVQGRSAEALLDPFAGRGAGAAVQRQAIQYDAGGTLPVETVDTTFNAWWKEFGAKADTVQKALDVTKDQIGPPMPPGYVPPPWRSTADPSNQCTRDPLAGIPEKDAQSVDPNAGVTKSPGAAKQAPTTGGGAAPAKDDHSHSKTSFAVKPGPWGIKYGVDAQGKQSVEGSFNEDLIKKTVPLFAGVFAEVSLAAKGTVTPSLATGDEFACTLGGSLDGTVTINGGVADCSVYAGGGASAVLTAVTFKRSASGEWTVTGPSVSIQVKLVTGLKVFKAKFEHTPGGSYEILKGSFTNGWPYLTFAPGEDVDRLKNDALAVAQRIGGIASALVTQDPNKAMKRIDEQSRDRQNPPGKL